MSIDALLDKCEDLPAYRVLAEREMRTTNSLAIVQAAAIVSGVVGLFCSALVYRHYTEHVFTPLLDFLGSINVALPPVTVLITTYVVALVTGKSVADAPRHVIIWMRNIFFQSFPLMVSAIVAACGLVALTAYITLRTAPPAYEEIVQLILGGESDDFRPAISKLDAINKGNKALAEQLRSVVKVFQYRHGLTSGGNKVANAGTLRVLVRTLEATDDSSWRDHPLRNHALGEAYSLYANLFSSQRTLLASAGVNEQILAEKARAAYQAVINSRDPRVVPLLRASAVLNLGNVLYREGDIEGALAAWRRANSPENGWRNTSAWGNIVAGLVLSGRMKEAIEEGVAAQNWAEESGKALREPNQYAAIVGNVGFARLVMSDFEGAIKDMAMVAVLVDDPLARMNAALAFALADRRDEAKEMIGKVASDPTPMGHIAASQGIVAPLCAYLIWDLADPDAPPAQSAARLLSYLEKWVSPDKLKDANTEDVKSLRKHALLKLRASEGGCEDFDLIPGVVARLGG